MSASHRLRRPLLSLAVLLLGACGASHAPSQAPREIATPLGPMVLEQLAGGLSHPWGLAFLPDGRLIVTERTGDGIVYDDGRTVPLTGLPEVTAEGAGGLMDVEASPDFATDRRLFFTYMVEAPDDLAVRLASYRLDGARLSDGQLLLTAENSGDGNVGSRIRFDETGHIFMSVGDFFRHKENWPQRLDQLAGKILRLNRDGSVPADNPFVSTPGARPEIWAYGVRNPQGLAFQPGTGALFETEHGPMGGDEVNVIKPGRNYGWPVIGYGIDYDGSNLHEATAKPGMEQPITHYVPSIAICGAAFHDGRGVPSWKGGLFVAALKSKTLRRLAIDGETVTADDVILNGEIGRIRDVEVGPDGYLYLINDEDQGGLYRLRPAAP